MNNSPDFNNIPCPVCKSTEIKSVLSSFTSVEAAAYFCPPSRNQNRNQRFVQSIESLWGGSHAYILRCLKCDFGFGFPFVGGDEGFYSILHEQSGYPGWKWDYNYTIEKVFNQLKIEKILDIGAGEGLFLKRLKPDTQKFATEGSDHTRKILQESGIHVFNDLEKIPENFNDNFDCITIFQVLEHISVFPLILKQANRLLKAGGKIVISVPELRSMIDQEKYTGCIDMIPNHINKFSENSLKLAMEDAGFVVERIIHEPAYFLKIFDSLHLYLINQATKKGTMANRVYAIQNKKLRTVFLGLLAIPAGIRLLPHVGKLGKGGSILAIAHKN